MSIPALDINRLTIDERLRLIEDLWESLVSRPDSIPLTDCQRKELDRRLDKMNCDGSPGTPWEEVISNIARD
ncbi:MAG: addiction module protein [Candidatus Hydrogenedentes bacterium]|nr:addiction module protein [Candidatus Hydrogenedentota bacterium]